jgi:ferrous iron transport protein A
MTPSELKPGNIAFIEQIRVSEQHQGLANRLEAMGIIPNKPITVLRKAWFGGPLHVRIGATTEIAIRHQEAQNILLRPQ